MSDEPLPETPLGIDPVASRRIFLGMLVLIAGAALGYNLFRPAAAPPPAAIAGDPLLVEGRAIYLARCVNCHGETGRGDGAIAKNLMGPPVGNLADAEWKHGDRPGQIVAVVAQGVPNTAMSAWKGVLDEHQLRAVTAYVLHLAGRKVPESFRAP